MLGPIGYLSAADLGSLGYRDGFGREMRPR